MSKKNELGMRQVQNNKFHWLRCISLRETWASMVGIYKVNATAFHQQSCTPHNFHQQSCILISHKNGESDLTGYI